MRPPLRLQRKKINTTKINPASIIKYLPYLPGLVVAIGLLRLSVFFEVFRINIFAYITLSEVILLSIKEVVMVFIYFFITFLLLEYLIKKVNLKIHLKDVRIKINKTIVKIFLGLILIIVIGLSLDYFIFKRIDLTKIIYPVTFYVILIQIGVALIIYKSKMYSLSQINFILFIVSYFCGIYALTDARARLILELKNNNKNLYSIFLKDKTTIQINDSIRFVGKVENFTFLYDKPLDKVIIINNEDIKKEDIQLKNQ